MRFSRNVCRNLFDVLGSCIAVSGYFPKPFSSAVVSLDPFYLETYKQFEIPNDAQCVFLDFCTISAETVFPLSIS